MHKTSVSCSAASAAYAHSICLSVSQCHGLWDNKEVDMPDFLKKLKRKKQKRREPAKDEDKGRDGTSPFVYLQGSTGLGFRRRKREGDHTEGKGTELFSRDP